MDAPRQPRRRMRLWPRVVGAILLAMLTLPALTTASALWMPIRRISHGTVERDGDHLNLWILEMRFPTGNRAIWFEKGRIYNKAGVGPPGGSSAAVANWSFATGTRSDPRYAKGEVSLPPEERARIGRSPATVWGVATDRRGWPWPALEAKIIGTMNSAAPAVYEVASGVPVQASALPLLGGRTQAFTGGSEALSDVIVVPLRPLWPGLLADLGCLTAIWWVVLMVVGTVWNWVAARFRRGEGRCRGCGYDLSGLTGGVCPECGAAVKA